MIAEIGEIDDCKESEKFTNCQIVEDIVPLEASIFYEDEKPFMRYVGKTQLSNGMKVKVEIPKMDLTIKEIELNTYSTGTACYNDKIYKREFHVVGKSSIIISEIERTVSLQELEKELGYKINLTHDLTNS